MFIFFVFCLFIILLSKSFSLKPSQRLKGEVGLLLVPFLWEELYSFAISCFWVSTSIFHVSRIVWFKKIDAVSGARDVMEDEKNQFLDLPELPLDKILERLSPGELCNMVGVCKSLRGRCRRDCLWKGHLERRWGEVLGGVALREWQWYVASRERKSLMGVERMRSLLGISFGWWPLSQCSEGKYVPRDSVMDLYLSVEKGEFWFPAQVFNRENGYVGFLMSCYDAKVSYHLQSNTFKARYLPQGWQATEENIQWHRIRPPQIDVPCNVLHISDCLHDLKPGDHVEIQWRRNEDFPYGWWYGVVGHLESCNGSEVLCRCHENEKVMLRFDQYNPSSQWRKTLIRRVGHKEEGNQTDGYYGGVRKLYWEAEIMAWKKFWPTTAVSE